MLYRLSLLFFVLALASLAMGIWNWGGLSLQQAQAGFTLLLSLSALSLLAELWAPHRHWRKKNAGRSKGKLSTH